jgi:hypothetical protein
MARLMNVKEEIRASVSSNTIASEVANALDGLFTIEFFKRHRAQDCMYTVLHCKPNRTVADALLLDREVLTLIINVVDVQVRTLHVAREIIERSDGRLDPSLIVVVHADRSGDGKLRAWGREQGYKIVPIYRSKAGALPPSETLRRNLAQDLFSQDPFSLTGPVLADADFFGRRNDALELLRQLQAGRIRSLFGIRKVGKTSLINRVVTLARDGGCPKIAMIDCSVDGFNKLGATDALKAVAKVAKLAAHRGYAHISDALRRSDEELVPVFDDLWAQKSSSPLAIIFDEVDYITPSSPIRPHWRGDFNIFWREFRVVYQEAQRAAAPLSVLVSGVSSHSFRIESIDGIENSVLHFIPEEYLVPFARDASKAMLKDLCRRCRLILSDQDRDKVAETCGDFPYWMRMAGSYIHRTIDVQGRPLTLNSELVSRLLSEFVESEGMEVARVALEDLRRKSSEPVDLLLRAIALPQIPLGEGKLLVQYGMGVQRVGAVKVTSSMITAAAHALESVNSTVPAGHVATGSDSLVLLPEEWAEELSVINRRRNLAERKLREFIHFGLKLTSAKGENWADKALRALPDRQRTELAALSGDALLGKLYWKDLGAIIVKHWPSFESTIGDKKRFETAMDLLNDRPDAHAKTSDAADIALYRRELTWLEDRLA